MISQEVAPSPQSFHSPYLETKEGVTFLGTPLNFLPKIFEKIKQEVLTSPLATPQDIPCEEGIYEFKTFINPFVVEEFLENFS